MSATDRPPTALPPPTKRPLSTTSPKKPHKQHHHHHQPPPLPLDRYRAPAPASPTKRAPGAFGRERSPNVKPPRGEAAVPRMKFGAGPPTTQQVGKENPTKTTTGRRKGVFPPPSTETSTPTRIPPPPRAQRRVLGELRQGSLYAGGEEREEDERCLKEYLLTRKAVLAFEVAGLEGRVLAEEERRRLKRRRVDDGAGGGGEAGEGDMELEMLVRGLLGENDASLSAAVSKPEEEEKAMVRPKATETETDTRTVPSCRPLPPPTSPSHPLYTLFTPLRVAGTTTALLPSLPVTTSTSTTTTATTGTTTSTTTTTTTHPLLKHTLTLATANPRALPFRAKVAVYTNPVQENVVAWEVGVCGWARAELAGAGIVGGGGGGAEWTDLGSVMWALGRYVEVSWARARVFWELSSAGGVTGRRKHRQTERERESGVKKFLGERCLLLTPTPTASGGTTPPPGPKVLVTWDLAFTPSDGAVGSRVSVNVEAGGVGGGGEAGREQEKLRRLEERFPALVREVGVVSAVSAVRGVVFGEPEPQAEGLAIAAAGGGGTKRRRGA